MLTPVCLQELRQLPPEEAMKTVATPDGGPLTLEHISMALAELLEKAAIPFDPSSKNEMYDATVTVICRRIQEGLAEGPATWGRRQADPTRWHFPDHPGAGLPGGKQSTSRDDPEQGGRLGQLTEENDRLQRENKRLQQQKAGVATVDGVLATIPQALSKVGAQEQSESVGRMLQLLSGWLMGAPQQVAEPEPQAEPEPEPAAGRTVPGSRSSGRLVQHSPRSPAGAVQLEPELEPDTDDLVPESPSRRSRRVKPPKRAALRTGSIDGEQAETTSLVRSPSVDTE